MFFLNDYNAPPIYRSGDINGTFNNMTRMSPGGLLVEIPSQGDECKIRWEKYIRMTSVPILSTQTGLLYGYGQDTKLADTGE